jgi:peptidoglycan endopeptidase LytE
MGLGVLFTTILLYSNASANETYSVKRGDTLSGVAAKTNLSLKALKAANHLKGSHLRIGQRLIIPFPPGKKPAKLEQCASLKSEGNITNPAIDDGEMEDNLASQEAVITDIETQVRDDSALFGKWSNPEEPKLLVKVAMGFLGAPYRLGGSSVRGIDCSGFVKKIYEMFNIDLPRTAYEQSHIGMRVERSELTEGDLLFFNTRRPIGHVGIYIGNNQFVHASSQKKGVRVDSLDTSYYDRRFVRAVRLKESIGSL